MRRGPGLIDEDDAEEEQKGKPDEWLTNARYLIIMAREDLPRLRTRLREDDALPGGSEDFGSYDRSITKISRDIAEVLKANREPDFKLKNQTSDILVKLGFLQQKALAFVLAEHKSVADEAKRNPGAAARLVALQKQDKKFVEHFQMRVSDAPTSRATLKIWLQEQPDSKDQNPRDARDNLIKALEWYIRFRTTEVRFYEANKKDKIGAARALLAAVQNGDGNQSLSLKELKALTSDDLGKIIAKFQIAVPQANYNEDTKRWDLERAPVAALEPEPEPEPELRRRSSK